MKTTCKPAFAALPPTLRSFGATLRRGRQHLLAAISTPAQDPLLSSNDGTSL